MARQYGTESEVRYVKKEKRLKIGDDGVITKGKAIYSLENTKT